MFRPQQQASTANIISVHRPLHFRFVLENSGVAEPQNIRDKFSEAIASGNPLMSRIQLDTMATIVDSGSFTADYSSRTPVSGILPPRLLPLPVTYCTFSGNSPSMLPIKSSAAVQSLCIMHSISDNFTPWMHAKTRLTSD